MAAADKSPVFFQSMWRGCSTYFWAKFRDNPAWRCFYEPLHEDLLSIKPCRREQASQGTGLRHPPVKEHYFAEYKLEKNGGAKDFQKRFCLENYHMVPDAKDASLEQYINGLLSHAGENGQRPFLQPNRAVLRAEWMRRTFGGTHIYLNRDFNMLMRSYYSFGSNLSYFLQCYAMIFGQNAHTPLFEEMAALKGLKPYKADAFDDERKHYGRVVLSWKRRDFCDIVAFVWVLGLAQASRYADIIIDVANLDSRGGRSALRDKLKSLTDADIDLSDFRSGRPGRRDDLKISEEAKRVIKSAVKNVDPNWWRLDEFAPSDTTRRFLVFVLT